MSRRGRPPHPDILTPREWEVVELIDQGLSNRQIADRLGLSFSGAKFHVSEILTKLGLSRRADVRAWLEGREPSRLPAFVPTWDGALNAIRDFGVPRLAAVTTLGAGIVALAVLALLVLSTPRGSDAVTVVDQGFSLVSGTQLTYAFLVENSDPRLALDGATYRTAFHDQGGKLVLERRGTLPLVLPGETAAVAEEAIQGAEEATRMTVTLEGGRMLPAEGLPAFHPVPMEGFSGGAADFPLTQVMTTLYSPYPGTLENVPVTTVFFASDGRILGGHTEIRAALPAGNSQAEMWLKYGPSEPDMSPHVVFYVSPAAGSLAQLQALQRAATQTPPEPGRTVRWQPATPPLFTGEEAPAPFAEQYGDITTRVYVVEGDGPAALVHETPRWVRWATWQGESKALDLDVITGEAGATMPDTAFLAGLVTLEVPGGSVSRTLIAQPRANFIDMPSPTDGRTVFQPSEHEIYLVEPDGSANRIEGLGERIEFVNWSPLGDAILVFVYETVSHRIQVDGRLYVVPVTDGIAQPIDPPMDGLQGRYAEWSPDGTRIAFVADGEPRTFEYAAKGDLFVFDRRTGDARRLLVHDGFLQVPVWTADGGHILLAGDLVDAATGNLVRLTGSPAEAIGGALSPDGRYLIVTEQPGTGACPAGDVLANRTLLRDLQTGDQRVLLDCDDGFDFVFSWTGSSPWLAGGRALALRSSSSWGGHGHFWKASLLDLETGELKTLTERPVEGKVDVLVSPDGDRIATTGDAARIFDSEGNLLATYEAPEGYEVRQATWSPDSSKLAFVVVAAHAFLGP